MLIPIILVAVGIGAFALTRKPSTYALGEDGKIPRFQGRLAKGQLYRVWARIDPTYVVKFREANKGEAQQSLLVEDLKKKLEKSGFYPILLAAQDPSASDVWTFLARWALDSRETFDTIPLHLYQLQVVDNPPESMRQPLDPPTKLDQGLLVDEIEAVKYALVHEDDHKHLTGFAFVLTPEFPIASSLLNAKAVLVEAASRRDVVAGQIYEKNEVLRKRYNIATQAVRFAGVFDWIGDTAESAVDHLKDLTSELGSTVEDMWNKYGGTVEVLGGWVPGPQIWMVETAYKVAKDINEGKPIGDVIPQRLSEQGTRFARGLQQVSPYLSMIPGVGTGVAMAINAAAALALAQPLDQMAIDSIALALPGGAIVQDSFRTAANFGNGMLRGEPWNEAAVNAAREAITKYGGAMGEPAAIVFDAGLALARGQSLQAAGFQALYQLTKGNELADRAARFAEAIVIAKQQGRSVKSVLIDQLAAALDEYGRPIAMKKVNETIALIQKPGNGYFLQKTPAELAKMLNIEETYANVAQAAVKEIAEGVRVVDPEIIRRLTPPSAVSTLAVSVNRLAFQVPVVQATTVNRLAYAQPTSPTALKMVESVRRPETSLVVDPAAAAKRLNAVVDAAKAGDAEAKKAKEALDKATRELERRKWIEWYRKQAQADKQPFAG